MGSRRFCFYHTSVFNNYLNYEMLKKSSRFQSLNHQPSSRYSEKKKTPWYISLISYNSWFLFILYFFLCPFYLYILLLVPPLSCFQSHVPASSSNSKFPLFIHNSFLSSPQELPWHYQISSRGWLSCGVLSNKFHSGLFCQEITNVSCVIL